MTDPIEAHLTTARTARAEGRRMDARNAYAQAAALSREGGEALLQAHALRNLSDIDREMGQADGALAHAEQALALYRAHGGEGADVASSVRLKALGLDALRPVSSPSLMGRGTTKWWRGGGADSLLSMNPRRQRRPLRHGAKPRCATSPSARDGEESSTSCPAAP